jgi:glycosyltransferase involved in cell wall biosynthesis
VLVSCLMPTKDRRQFVPGAIECFQRQTYPERELIILDDGEDSIADLIPRDPRIVLIRWGVGDVGAKRRICAEVAIGGLLAYWDDDDWHGPRRLEVQINAMRERDAQLSFLVPMLFHHTGDDYTVRYSCAAVGTLVFTRQFYALHGPIVDGKLGDRDWLIGVPHKGWIYVDGEEHYVARRHGANSTTFEKIGLPKADLPAGYRL